jgi:hypothetical protein
MAVPLLLSGAKVVLYVNGNLFGKVSSFKYASATPRKKIRGVDSMVPFELGMTTNDINGTMTVYRLIQDGGAEGAGMVAPIVEIPREKYFSLILVDIASNTVIFEADYCSVEDQSWTFEARDLAKGQITFSALDYLNEVRPVG